MFKSTKKVLLDFIKRKGAISLDQAVQHTQLGKTTLRGHILQLERDGYVEHKQYRSGPGRPTLHYKLTPKGNDLFPSYESNLIKDLLIFLKNRGDEKTVELFFEGFWNERLEKAKKLMNQASEDNPELRLKALENMLEDEGFMPEIDFDSEEHSLTIKACNCPFGDVVKETRLPCKLEAMFYKKLLDEHTERITYIAEGDPFCTYKIAIGDQMGLHDHS